MQHRIFVKLFSSLKRAAGAPLTLSHSQSFPLPLCVITRAYPSAETGTTVKERILNKSKRGFLWGVTRKKIRKNKRGTQPRNNTDYNEMILTH